MERVLDSKQFAEGCYDNGFLERMINDPESGGNELVAALAVAMVLNQDRAASTLPSRWKMHGRRMTIMNRLSSGML